MEIKPHPSLDTKAILSIESLEEDIFVHDSLPIFSARRFRGVVEAVVEDLNLLLRGVEHPMPKDVILTRRDLGKVSCRGFTASNATESMPRQLSRQIESFLAN